MKSGVTGLILAGGRGVRMGGVDKGLLPLDGRPLVEHILQRLRPQVTDIVISANRGQERYVQFGHRVIADLDAGYLGPLAGIASGLSVIATDYAATVPCDSPRISAHLVERLRAALHRENTGLAVAHDGQRQQPLFMLIRCVLLPDLRAFLTAGECQVERWLRRHRVAVANFDNQADFANINDMSEYRSVEAQRQS